MVFRATKFPTNHFAVCSDLENRRTRSLKQIMENLDLQKKMDEAAQERSSIAKALLGIQRSLDNMEPAVSRMEPVL